MPPPTARLRRPNARKHRSTHSDSAALLRLAAFTIALGGLVWTVPPLRAGFGAMRDTLVLALEISRASDANRVAIARDAIRYGIDYELSAAIRSAAKDEGIDPELGLRLVRVESEFHERAVSPVGALGLTQLMPATAAELQPGITREEILQRDTNLRLGFRYLRGLLRAYDGRVSDALHAYNRGPGTVDRIRARGGDPANGYARKVLRSGELGVYGGTGFRASGDGILSERAAKLVH